MSAAAAAAAVLRCGCTATASRACWWQWWCPKRTPSRHGQQQTARAVSDAHTPLTSRALITAASDASCLLDKGAIGGAWRFQASGGMRQSCRLVVQASQIACHCLHAEISSVLSAHLTSCFGDLCAGSQCVCRVLCCCELQAALLSCARTPQRRRGCWQSCRQPARRTRPRCAWV
jgi:hypothetical protein